MEIQLVTLYKSGYERVKARCKAACAKGSENTARNPLVAKIMSQTPLTLLELGLHIIRMPQVEDRAHSISAFTTPRNT